MLATAPKNVIYLHEEHPSGVPSSSTHPHPAVRTLECKANPTLQYLSDELHVTSVWPCDEEGRIQARTVRIDHLDQVLPLNKHYLIRRKMPLALGHGPSTNENNSNSISVGGGGGASSAPNNVTFERRVMIRQFDIERRLEGIDDDEDDSLEWRTEHNDQQENEISGKPSRKRCRDVDYVFVAHRLVAPLVPKTQGKSVGADSVEALGSLVTLEKVREVFRQSQVLTAGTLERSAVTRRALQEARDVERSIEAILKSFGK